MFPHSNSQQVPLTMSAANGETDVNASSGESVHLPPVPTNTSLTGSLSKINDRVVPTSSEMETSDHTDPRSSDHNIKLPALAGNGSLVAIVQRNNRDEAAAAEPGSSTSQEAITKPRHSARNEATTSLASHEATRMEFKGSSSHESALKPGRGNNPRAVRNSSSNDQLSSPKHSLTGSVTMRKSASPVKLQSQMKLTRHSTFKDTPLGYKPAAVHNQRDSNTGNGEISHNTDQDTRDTTIKFSDPIPDANREQQQHGLLTAAQTKNSSSMEQLDIVDNTHGSMISHSPHSPSLDEHLYQQAQRYDKLNQVLTLLQQAKDGKTLDSEGSEPGTPVKISELKAHIKTALDEAVRLRADTEALQQRVITTVTVSLPCT